MKENRKSLVRYGGRLVGFESDSAEVAAEGFAFQGF